MKMDEVFRKLRPVMGPKLDLLWQEYIVADAPIRRDIERILRIQLGQRLQETFESNNVLLKPPPAEIAKGNYPVGDIFYAALFPQKEGVVFNKDKLLEMPNLLTDFLPEGHKYEDVVKVYEADSDRLQIMCDIVSRKVICFFA
jgi:hypothetical protein